MKAPEKIWVLPWERNDDGDPWWGEGDWHVVLSDEHEAGHVAYVRADIHARSARGGPKRMWLFESSITDWGKGPWYDDPLYDEPGDGMIGYIRADVHDSEIAHLNLRMLQQAERIAELEAMLIRRAGGK
jgi:hypothetical protein